MRTQITVLLALLTVGCVPDEESSSYPEDGYIEETIGVFEAADPSDPTSRWTGSEYTRILGAEGDLLCEGTLFARGSSIDDSRFDLTIEVGQAEDRDPQETCSLALEQRTRFESLYLTFVGEQGRFGEERGSVFVGDDLDEAEFYARGTLMEGTLMYRQTRWISEDDAPTGEVRPSGDAKAPDDSPRVSDPI